MKKVMIIFEIPDNENIDQDVIPKLSHCRIRDDGVDMICSTPVKIIDCPSEISNYIEKHNID